MHNVIGVILGGGQGKRLYPLTQYRSKPAVPIGGKYRLIDIPISNCLHSGVRKVYVLTQFNSHSLHRHIATTYRFDSFSDGFVEILAAEQTMENGNWYQGTADAVRKQLRRIQSRQSEQVLILSGDHLYRMDYGAFVREHRERGADVSIAVQPVSRDQAPALGILKVDDEGRITTFREKPSTDAELAEMRAVGPQGEEIFLASMGIYVFEPQVLTSMLLGNEMEDFGKHIIPAAIDKLSVCAHTFDGYWADIGTIGAFYRANLGLADRHPPFRFDETQGPVYTHQRYLAGSRMDRCRIDRSIVAEGCRMSDTEIEHSIVGVRSTMESGVRVYSSVIMGADRYESARDMERNAALGIPNIGIGGGSVVHRAIVDKNARIGEKVVIANDAGVQELDGDGYYIRDGIVVIPKDGVIPSGTTI